MSEPREQRLIVVAGPSAAGKTTLIRQLRRGRLPALAQRLDLGDYKRWHYTTGEHEEVPRDASQILLDYNASLFFRRGRPYQEDPSLATVERAQRVCFLTVWTPPERLGRQYLADHLRRAHPSGFKAVKRLGYALPRSLRRRLSAAWLDRVLVSRHRDALLGAYREPFTRQFANLYADPHKVLGLYRNWLAFCRLHEDRTELSVLVELYDEARLLTPEEWEIVAQRYESQETA